MDSHAVDPVSRFIAQSHVTPPRLDSHNFVKKERVPIIDVLERSYFKEGKDGKKIKITESVDEEQLKTLLENTRLRELSGKYPMVLLGHTTDDGREIDQPPTIGWLKNHQMGEHEGKPTILADIYFDRRDCDPSRTMRQFPRRSAEVINISKPNGYIDALSLIKRTPERDLGLVTSQFSRKGDVYRFICPDEVSRMSIEAELARREHKSKKIGVVKTTAKLLTDLVSSCIEDPSEEDKAKKKSRLEDDEHDDMMDPSEEDSEMASRYAKKKNFEPDPSEEEEMSSSSGEEPMDNSSDSSSSSSGEPMPKKKAKREEPSRMDPSRMCDNKMTKAKMSADGGAGMPGPTTSPPETINEQPAKVKSVKVKSSRMSLESERMRDDDARIGLSRLQKRAEKQDEIIARLQAQIESDQNEKRQAILERKLIQLQAEGVELDRAEELARFLDLNIISDEQVDREISRMRKNFKSSPVGAPMIPSFTDLGGSTVERPKTVQQLRDPLPEEFIPGSQEPTFIFGSHIARFAAQNKLSVSHGHEIRDAKSVVEQYLEKHKVSR